MTDRRITNKPWMWVQPADYDELVERLAIARDLAVPERERENLCACAHTALKALLAERKCQNVDRERVG